MLLFVILAVRYEFERPRVARSIDALPAGMTHQRAAASMAATPACTQTGGARVQREAHSGTRTQRGGDARRRRQRRAAASRRARRRRPRHDDGAHEAAAFLAARAAARLPVPHVVRFFFFRSFHCLRVRVFLVASPTRMSRYRGSNFFMSSTEL